MRPRRFSKETLKHKTMSKPKENPFLPKDKQPTMVCMTCGHSRMRENREGNDYASLGCGKTGTSHVAPMHTCSAWIHITKKQRKD